MKKKLYQHQSDLVDLNPKKHLLAWETGTGKTLAAIELAKKNAIEDTLVVVPKSLFEQWEEQISQAVIEKMQSTESLEDLQGMMFGIITKENFRRDWKVLPKRNCLIIDEAHYFSGIKSAMHKSLINYIKKHDPQYIYLLTATPYLSTPFNIYCLARILGVNWNYQSFKRNFFNDIRMGSRIIPVIKKNIEPKIAKLVNTLGNTVALQDCVDVPEQTFQTETFSLTKEQEKAIKEVEEAETNHIVKWTKIHQICGGTIKGDGYTDTKYFSSDKLGRLKDICSEHKKVVVVCRYNAEVEMIAKELEISLKRKGYIATITGKTINKNEVIKASNKMNSCIIIANAACCEGYELPTFDLMVFYSYDFSLKNYIQMKGRIQRITNPKKNVYLSLITKDTIDEDVYKTIQKKKSFDLAIYGK